jgi:cytochrome b
MKKIRLWDAPTRIFHWSLFVLVSAAFATGLTGGGLMDWHGRIGAAIAGLIAFRLVWGFLGNHYARFTTFVRGPASIAAYLKGEWHGLGHNPLGALSVLGMLGVLLLQVTTGLFSDDDIAFRGPYNILVGENIESLALFIHNNAVWLIGLLVFLHLGAITFYLRVKGDNLIKPMITGIKEVPAESSTAETPEPDDNSANKGGGMLALVVALGLAATVVWAALGGPVKYLLPPPPPAVETPNW